MTEFYAKYPTAAGYRTWEAYQNNPDDPQFDSDDDPSDKLFVPQG